jgi:hypothetical protein
MRILKFIGYLLAALVAVIASYVFIFSGSFHTPTGVLTPAPYVSPADPSSSSAAPGRPASTS